MPQVSQTELEDLLLDEEEQDPIVLKRNLRKEKKDRKKDFSFSNDEY